MIILSLFAVIYFKFAPLLMVAGVLVGIFTLIALGAIIDLAGRVAELSKEYSQGRRRNMKEDNAMFRSCRPLETKISGVFTINKITFPHIVNDVIISTVIDLLVIIRGY